MPNATFTKRGSIAVTVEYYITGGDNMSGIVGFYKHNFNFKNDTNRWKNILETMKQSIGHRGGNHNIFFIEEDICLCQTSNEYINTPCKNGLDYENILVSDHDIFNIEGFKKNESVYDSILNLILKDGKKAVKEINGGFAIALYERKDKKLTLFRDHAGVKPLFYAFYDGFLIFASEIKAILKFEGFRACLDSKGLSEIFALGPARIPNSGVFKNVYSVVPGHFVVFDRRKVKNEKFWDVRNLANTKGFKETVDDISYLLRDAVKIQSKTDDFLCTFLSGGIDSSIVTALVAKEQNHKLSTFSFDFVDNDVNFISNSFQPELDREYVDIMVNECNTKHRYLFCDSEELAQNLFPAVKARDLPGMADIDASLLYFCKQVKAFNGVVLTGECADELFAGYPWFHKEELYNTKVFPWSVDTKSRKMLLSNDLLAKIDIDAMIFENYENTLKMMPEVDTEIEGDKMRQVSYLTMKWFMATLGDRMDRMSQSAGILARMPFADKRIIEYLYNVPFEFKNHGGIVKGLLREAFKNDLPNTILYRKKNPYPKTYNPSYEKLLTKAIMAVMKDKNSPISSLLDIEKVKEFVSTPTDYVKPWYGQLMSANQLLAYMLQVNYWILEYNITII